MISRPTPSTGPAGPQSGDNPMRPSFQASLKLLASGAAVAQSPPPADPHPALSFENVRIFDGVSERLSGPSNVLVAGDALSDVTLLEDPAANLVVIEKDGVVYENTAR